MVRDYSGEVHGKYLPLSSTKFWHRAMENGFFVKTSKRLMHESYIIFVSAMAHNRFRGQKFAPQIRTEWAYLVCTILSGYDFICYDQHCTWWCLNLETRSASLVLCKDEIHRSSVDYTKDKFCGKGWMGLFPDTKNCGLCMHRECRVRLPRQWRQWESRVNWSQHASRHVRDRYLIRGPCHDVII